MPSATETRPRPAPSRRAPARSRRRAAPPRTRATGPRRRRSWLWRYRRILFLFGLLGATAIGGIAYVIAQVPLPKDAPLAQTTILTDASGKQLAVLHGDENRLPVKLNQVPKVLQDAVVAAEDRKFFSHSGVDPVGVIRATWADLRHHAKVQGGSSITQQYVKNTYVGRERTLMRKVKEAVIAMKLERKYNKRQILERYLNTIYFGRGAYGVQAAAHAYFDTDVQKLGLPQSAFLAGLIRGPEQADPARGAQQADVARQRRSEVLQAMVDTHAITSTQRTEADAVPIESKQAQRKAATIASTAPGAEYYVDYVRRQLVKTYGEDAVLRGGLRVKTTLDQNLQRQAYDAVYKTLNWNGDPDGALVAMDTDGHVVAMVGGRNWDKSKVNLAVGTDGGGTGRQAGSAFKPFVLAETLHEGYTPESSFLGPGKIVLPHADAGRDWEVSNFENESYGRLNLFDATAHSVNTVYAQLVTAIGPDKVVPMAQALGVNKSHLDPVPSITLGTQNVSVMEMADSYLSFANEGVQTDPQVFSQITDAGGAVLYDGKPHRNRALTRDQARVMNFTLSQVVEHGTGTGANFGGPLAGKTGTTEDYGDAWFVGYTPKLVSAVWMGYPEGQSRQMTSVHGMKVNGGSLPATIFEKFMSRATRDPRYSGGDFPKPDSFPGKVLGQRVAFVDQSPAPSSATSTPSTVKTKASTPASSTPPTTGGPNPTQPSPRPTTPPQTTPPEQPTTPPTRPPPTRPPPHA
jgi:penicillin-binding protein 1A